MSPPTKENEGVLRFEADQDSQLCDAHGVRARAVKTRGAISNPPGRFDRSSVENVDDGWYHEETSASVATSVEPDKARAVITTNDSPDIPFSQSINPYRGCEHGCIYCYARPSHSYMGLSPGLDFETRLFFKAEAGNRLREQLARPGYSVAPIMLGANTDPYQPVEKRLAVTREILQILQQCRHPVSVVTKGALILRDVDLLGSLAADGLVNVMISITTLNADTKRTLEPRAASPQARLKVIAELSKAKVPVGVMVAPVIPVITDHEMEQILESAATAGARSAAYVVLRLPYEVKTLFREWLEEHHPLKARHVMSLVQSLRGGRDNDPRFGSRMRGEGPFADLLRMRFATACRRFGLNTQRDARLNTALFVPPRPASPQMGFAF
jgi:DNA repair photolyase